MKIKLLLVKIILIMIILYRKNVLFNYLLIWIINSFVIFRLTKFIFKYHDLRSQHKYNNVKRSCWLSSGIKWRHAPPSQFHASQTSAICEYNLRANWDFTARQLRLLPPRSTRYTIVSDF